MIKSKQFARKEDASKETALITLFSLSLSFSLIALLPFLVLQREKDRDRNKERGEEIIMPRWLVLCMIYTTRCHSLDELYGSREIRVSKYKSS